MTVSTRSGALRTDRALLVLEDGTIYRGYGYGATGASLGEAVFSTGMTGYQETLTDPSYAGQIVAQTAPHIGNTGVNTTDAESRKIWVAGYVVRDAARVASNWRSERTLEEELIEQGIVGIQGIDTRALTRRLRSHGSMRAGVFSGRQANRPDEELLSEVRASEPMAGRKLADSVTIDKAYTIEPHEHGWFAPPIASIVALDLGIKAMTPQRFAERGVRVHVLPANATLNDIYAHNPQGVFFSNGPGDPATADEQVELLRRFCVKAPRSLASASATSFWDAPSASAPTSCPSGTAALTSPSWTKPPGKLKSPPKTTGSPSMRPSMGRSKPPLKNLGA